MSDLNPEPTVHAGAVDTHCHLFLLDLEPPAVVEAARAAGVERIICVGIDVETSRRSLELAESIPGVFATAGMHPHDASAFDATASTRIEELLHDPRVVGVGECGLDYFRMLSPVDDQLRTLRTHISLSNESAKPMVVHVRDAWEDTLRVLDEGSAEHVVIHCFSGDADIARECAARGYHLSFAANVTYPKNDHLRQAAAAVPQDRLLTETDSPFLSPQATRGRPNHPGNVQAVIAELASARNELPSDITAATGANARDAFPAMK
ncbi:MAG: TatD DNase family protein [Actinomycetota bacterium]|nr:TatD DNase family protein [Actinomycetota bacterium]